MEMEEFLGNLAIKASFLSIMRQSLDVNFSLFESYVSCSISLQHLVS